MDAIPEWYDYMRTIWMHTDSKGVYMQHLLLQYSLFPEQSFPSGRKSHESKTTVCIVYRSDISVNVIRLEGSRIAYRDDSSPLYVTSLSGAMDKAVPGKNMMRAIRASAMI